MARRTDGSAMQDASARAFSLRRRLLIWMAVPLLVFVLFDAWLGYRNALQTTQSAYDRLLVTAAHALGDMIRLERGELQVTLPHSALELYSTDVRTDLREQPGRSPLLYRVNFLNGDFLAGDAALPAYTGLPPLNDVYASRLQFYDRDMEGGEPARFVALWQPVESSEGMRYVVVQVGEYVSYRYAIGRTLLWNTLARQCALLLLLLVAMWVVATAALRPLRVLARSVEQRSHDDLRPIATADTPEEVGPLLSAFNGLLARVDGSRQRQQRFVADASHQLRTPLAVLQLHAESGLKGDVPAREALASIADTTGRTSRVVHQLLMWNRAQSDQADLVQMVETVELQSLMRDVAVELSPLLARRQLDFSLEGPEKPAETQAMWHGERWMVEEILKNLLTNAIQHAPERSALGMRLKESGEGWELEVWDGGAGLAQAVADRLFEPFITGGGGKGAGLGLAICRDLALALGGTLSVRNRTGTGQTGVSAVLRLPKTPHES
ncbi:sensor histidine kinase [Diaphorobacter sp. HDW4A]|uniref:sensor histidine kinase n=1 Tax=Diaphorobacter sp. HDW4A TaxID=2714924 RepID=UPI00140C7D0E|nr:sensor histidine kinase [Diaphorobacter sp. HDW4A]QIL83157.1 sensor histidine kinase [Diaphorobacter sp. HDW4A]